MRALVCCALMLTAVVLTLSPAAADTVNVTFCRDGSGYLSGRTVNGAATPSAAINLMLQGPSAEEAAAGIYSAIPEGTKLLSVQQVGNGVDIELSDEVLVGLDDLRCETIFKQFLYTMEQFGLGARVHVLVDGKPLSSYLAPLPPAVYAAPVKPVRSLSADRSLNTVGLSGFRITISPGHGYVWTGTYWATQRGIVCTYPPEDFHDLDIAQYLRKYLEGDGAYVQYVREFDKNRGTGPSGHPWWQDASYAWLRDAGYSCSVYASYTGSCTYTGPDRGVDDVRCRGLASNLDSRGDTDVFLSIHTNSANGTAKGTTVFYCDTGEHVAYGPASIELCDYVGDAVVDAIQSAGETCADGTTWACLANVCTRYGDLGEARIPQRPACIIELGFHDNCTADAPKLEEPFFQSVSMWGEYKGVCDYLGVTPGWAMYSNEFVTHDIPTSMTPGQVATVHITYKNRGVLWTNAKGFKLSAVGGTDPFTSTVNYAVGTDTSPADNYTFTLTLTAPSTTGTYVTDWQMQRTGYQSFGATCSQTVTVSGTADTTPPSVPTGLAGYAPSQTSVNLTWNASTDNRGVAGYKVYRGGAYIGSSATTSYTDSTAAANTTYSYQVSAYDTSNNESAKCTAVGVTTPPYITIILDEDGGTSSGSWTYASGVGTAAYNGDYKYSITASSETAWYKWTPNLTRAGNWDVYVMYREGTNRTAYAPYTIYYKDGSQTYTVNQTTGGAVWQFLGTKEFLSGTTGYVKLGNLTSDTGKAIIADAVKFYYKNDALPTGPTITTQPSAQSVCSGATASFTVAASGSGTLTYQWQKNQVNLSNGGDISGATSTTLQIANCDASDAANYRCVVTDANGSTASNEAALTLKTATSITTHPSNATVGAGSTATFSVVAAGSNLTYQWQKNSVNLSNGGDISGATSATLSIANAEDADEGSYRCVVTGDCGSATSNTATLTVDVALTTVILDENQGTYSGAWSLSTGAGTNAYNGDYKYTSSAVSETAWYKWTPTLGTGNYAVYVMYRSGTNRPTNARYTIYYNGGSQTYTVNQTINGGTWVLLGTKSFVAGTSGYVKLSNDTDATGTAVIADAVKWVPQ